MNYFNYFTEIEDTFIRRRGKHLLLSPVDWALIESWKEKGVPLFVALRGIEHAFDSYEAKPRRRSVKSLMYCQEEVEAQFAEWLDSQIGAEHAPTNGEAKGAQPEAQRPVEEARLPFSRTAILEHLAHAHHTLAQLCAERQRTRKDELCDAFSRAASRLQELENDFARTARPDAQRLEDSLTHLEKLLDETLRANVPADELTTARADAEAQLTPYSTRMERITYEQTLDNLLLKRLREQHGVPRLSLFYL